MNNKRFKLKQIIDKDDMEFQIFHENTKTKRIIRHKNSNRWPKATKTIFYKAYQRMSEILLPEPKRITGSLRNALIQRKSNREFSDKQLSLDQISSLLYYSAGIKDAYQNRFYPSAGKRYPLEIYLLTNKTDLAHGFYHYYVKNNSLEEMIKIKSFKYSSYFIDDWIKDANMLIIITSVFKRSVVKYGTKGYRFALIECGHLAQNIYLLSSLLNLNCCEVGGFVDDRLHTLLDIDGKDEAVLSVIAVGNK